MLTPTLLSVDLETLEQSVKQAGHLSGMYERFLSTDLGDGPERTPGIHASELGCLRQAYYTAIGKKGKTNVPLEWRKRFDHGHAVHAMIQRHFHAMAKASKGAFTFESEVRIHPSLQPVAAELDLHSSADGLFTFFREDSTWFRVLLEIKTEAEDGWNGLKEPRDYHVDQTHVYMHALNVPICWVLYFNKATQAMTNSKEPWLVRYNPAIWARLEERIYEVLFYRDISVLPPAEESFTCTFCKYRGPSLCNPKILQKKQKQREPPRRF